MASYSPKRVLCECRIFGLRILPYPIRVCRKSSVDALPYLLCSAGTTPSTVPLLSRRDYSPNLHRQGSHLLRHSGDRLGFIVLIRNHTVRQFRIIMVTVLATKTRDRKPAFNAALSADNPRTGIPVPRPPSTQRAHRHVFTALNKKRIVPIVHKLVVCYIKHGFYQGPVHTT